MAIFPIVFANDLQAGSGPGLVFITLPLAFGKLPYGDFFGAIFFLLLTFAAWTSAISLLEPAVTWLVENRGLKRVTATMITGIATWMLGLLTVFSFQKDSPIIFNFTFNGEKKENGVFDVLDILSANIMLPLGGLLIAFFAGWIMSREASRDELEIGDGTAYQVWQISTRYIAPTLVAIVFLDLIGVLDAIKNIFSRIF